MLSKRDFPQAMNGGFKPCLVACRCPRCRSTTLELTETIDAYTHWEVVDGRMNMKAGILEPGQPSSLTAICRRCSHQWSLRSAPSLLSVLTELDPETLLPTGAAMNSQI
jgi:hypothetical protein